MKPYKSFLFLFSLLALSSLFIGLYPYPEFILTDRISIAVPTKEDLIIADQTEIKKAYQDSILRADQQKIIFDSLKKQIISAYIQDSTRLFTPSLSRIKLIKFEYDTSIQYPLSPIFDELDKQNPNLRILHYGDEQIANDHISSALRNRLQTAFSGYGQGLISLYSHNSYANLEFQISNNWQNMTLRENGRRGSFGICNAYLYPPPIYSLGFEKTRATGKVQINLDKASSIPQLCEILVHEDLDSAQIKLRCDGKIIKSIYDSLYFGLRKISYPIESNSKLIQLQIPFTKNANLYGISLKSSDGICLDNLPLKKNRGYIFSLNNPQFLNNCYHLLDIKMLIYQFGNNLIDKNPERTKQNISNFEINLRNELNYYKSINPDIPLILIGIGDRDVKKGNVYLSDSNAYYIREIQKRLAIESGCLYWDLFQAMGGDKSMGLWVNESLANKDHIHFTKKGSDLIGLMLYKALLNDYITHLKEKERQQIKDLNSPN